MVPNNRYQVMVVSTSDKAKSTIANRDPYDLVIADQRIDDDYRGLLTAIAADQRYNEVPVFLLSDREPRLPDAWGERKIELFDPTTDKSKVGDLVTEVLGY